MCLLLKIDIVELGWDSDKLSFMLIHKMIKTYKTKRGSLRHSPEGLRYNLMFEDKLFLPWSVTDKHDMMSHSSDQSCLPSMSGCLSCYSNMHRIQSSQVKSH